MAQVWLVRTINSHWCDLGLNDVHTKPMASFSYILAQAVLAHFLGTQRNITGHVAPTGLHPDISGRPLTSEAEVELSILEHKSSLTCYLLISRLHVGTILSSYTQDGFPAVWNPLQMSGERSLCPVLPRGAKQLLKVPGNKWITLAYHHTAQSSTLTKWKTIVPIN